MKIQNIDNNESVILQVLKTYPNISCNKKGYLVDRNRLRQVAQKYHLLPTYDLICKDSKGISPILFK
jgi:hypothetical protein